MPLKPLKSVVHGPWSVVRSPWSAVRGLWSGINQSTNQLIILVLLFSGCTSLLPERLEVDVPFFAQTENRCGVSALRMVANYHGCAVDAERLEKDLFVPFLKGTTPGLVADTAEKMGLAADVVEGSREQLIQWLEDGIIPIVFFGSKAGDGRGHFAVVTGLRSDGKGVRIHGEDEPNQWMSEKQFEEAWKAGRYTAVVVREGK